MFVAIPVNANGVIDQNSVRCSFEDLGTSLGMYVNETTVICVSPHAPGGPSAYSRETVIAAVALNGQDYNEIDSTALVTFIGTGGGRILQYLVFALLLALLLLSCAACWTGWCIQDPNLKSITQQSAS